MTEQQKDKPVLARRRVERAERFAMRPSGYDPSPGLLGVTLLLTFLYLRGAIGFAGWHDAVYFEVVMAGWVAFFCRDRLLAAPMVGSFLACLTRLVAVTAFAALYGYVYWRLYAG